MEETHALTRIDSRSEEESDPALSVVVTLYNEADSLDELHRRTVAALEALGRTFEIVYVDDGSTDGSWAALTRLYAEHENVRVVRLRRNFGKATALQAGFAEAAGDVMTVMSPPYSGRQTRRKSRAFCWRQTRRRWCAPRKTARCCADQPQSKR